MDYLLTYSQEIYWLNGPYKYEFINFILYKKLFEHQTELETKCEIFDPTDYDYEIDIKQEPLESSPICHFHQLQIKEEPL